MLEPVLYHATRCLSALFSLQPRISGIVLLPDVAVSAILGAMAKHNDSAAFETLLDSYWETELERNPVLANHSGLSSGEGRLNPTGLKAELSSHKRRLAAFRKLESISPRDLSPEQHIDRLAMRALLLGGCEDFELGHHTMQPDAPEHLLNLLLHELQRGDDEPARAARNIRAVLALAGDHLIENAAMITHPEPVWLKIMQETVDGMDSLFEAVSTFLKQHPPGGRPSGWQPSDADVRLIESVKRAVKRYRVAVESKPVAPNGAFAVGPVILQRRVRDELGLDYSLAEIESLALAEARRIGTLLDAECHRVGGAGQPEVILNEARAMWNPGGDLLACYRRETERVARAFQSARAVSFPRGQSLEVRPVPEFMRHMFPTAAYASPGAFEKRQRGIFWVNDLSTTKRTEAEKLAERQQHFGMSLTAAHEAYPGHHLQFTTANKHPRRWRRMFAHAVFYEGWTLWCEQMVVDLKIDTSPWVRVQQLHDALWRVHRILVDLRLQTRRYTHEQAVRHMMKHLGFTRARAAADVNWYTSSPAAPMSYWLGRLENERLHARLVKGRGWKLQRFNDWLLSFGTVPQAWIEKYGLD